MASRDRWIWHLWLSCNHPSQNNSSSPASKLNRNMGTSGLLTSQNSPNQPIIMTSQPEWQAMAHNCRDFKHPNRHFAAKPTETCLLWSTQPIPSRTRDLAQNRWLTASDSDRSDRSENLIDAHPASDVLLASVAEQNMARPQRAHQLQLLRRSPQSC